ncbi:unnamed protein product, partial [Cylicostephanus goldi]
MMLYIRYKDMDYAFLPIDVDTIPKFYKEMIRDGKLELDEIERLLATGTHFSRTGAFYFYEYVRKIPTTLGMPLVLTSKMPTVGTIHGQIKIEMEPKESRTFDGLRLHLILKPKVATTHVVMATIMHPVVETGFKMLHSVMFEHPIEMETEVTWRHQLRLKTVFRPVEHKTNVLHLQTRPVIFVRHMKKVTHAYHEPREVTLRLHEHRYPVMTFENTFLERFGHKIIVTGTMHRPIVRRMESMLHPILFGYNTVDVIIEPTEDFAKEYVFNMEMEAFVPERLEGPKFEKLFRHNDEFFEEEEMEPRHREERRNELTTYLRDYHIEKAYRHRLLCKLETVGMREKHEVEMELKAVCDHKYRYCRTNFFLRRTPFLEKETRHWELKLNAETVYPEMPKTIEELKKMFNREFHGLVDVTWGTERMNTLFIRMQSEPTYEQKMWMEKFDRKENMLTEMDKLRVASDRNLHKFMVKYELIPETEHFMHNLFMFFDTWNMWNTEYKMVPHEEKMLRLQLEIEPLYRRTFDLLVETPEKRIVMKNLMLPFVLPTLNIHDMRMLENVGVRDVIRHVVKHNRPECIVKSWEVNTFDKLRLKTPLTTCYTILAKDCHSEEPRFVVMMKKMVKDREEKALKIVTPRDVYVLEMVNDELVIRVNDKVITHEELM